MGLECGGSITVQGRSGVIDQIDSDGVLYVWFGALRQTDGARICERVEEHEILPLEEAAEVLDAKKAKRAAIDLRTDALIAEGFRFPPEQGPLFSLTPGAQQQLTSAYVSRNHPLFTYPVRWGSMEGTSIELSSAAELEMFYLLALQTARSHLDSGQALKARVVAASTKAAVEEVGDDR
jgi:hypothetical protein